MSGYNNGKREFNMYDSSVYAPINKCTFIPDCAFERMIKSITLPSGDVVVILKSDNSKYYRIVYAELGQTTGDPVFHGVSGVLIKADGQVVWKQTNGNQQGRNLTKQLKALFTAETGIECWAAYHTDAGYASI